MNESAPSYWAVIPAAGIGRRFNKKTPKQYSRINGRTVLEHSVYPLLQLNTIKKIVIAIASGDTEAAQLPLLKDSRIEFVQGGNSRTESVLNALIHLQKSCDYNDWVLVHDAARPCLSPHDLHKLILALQNAEHGALLAVRSTDTIKFSEDHYVHSTLDRNSVWRALTPQAFRFSVIFNALQSALDQSLAMTDESSAIEITGGRPLLVEGLQSNIKITFSADLELAAFYLSKGISSLTLNHPEGAE